MVMNDTGRTIIGAGNWVKPTKANRIDAVNKLRTVNIVSQTQSNSCY